MFDSADLAELDKAATAAVAVSCHAGLVEHECGQLQVAAHWADLHPGDLPEPGGRPGREGGRLLGGVGTPEVAEFAASELGPLLETTTGSARHLMADALDLRHRLPRLWGRVVARQVRAGKARRVAEATRQLAPEAAAAVDAAVAGAITELPWGRFQDVLAAAVLAADPAGEEARGRQADAERFVRAGRANAHGLKLLVAKAAAGDVIWFLAMVGRIADILQAQGDPDPVDVRRSKAIGILAQPAEALRLLLEHQHDDPHLADPSEPEPDDGDASPQTSSGPENDQADPEAATTAEDGSREADTAGASAFVRSAGHRSVRLSALPIDPARCRPRAVVYVHLSGESLLAGTGVARVEDVGPVLLSRLRRLLGGRCQLILKPVLDLAEDHPVDGYEVPVRMREILRVRQPASVFPYGVNTGQRMDADHTIPYLAPDQGGRPGQTGIGKLGFLTRGEHRVRTFGSWRVRQPEPGKYVWRSPLGYVFLVDSRGTHPLGNGSLADAVWGAVREPAPDQASSPLVDLFTAHLETLPKITIPWPTHPSRPGRRGWGREGSSWLTPMRTLGSE